MDGHVTRRNAYVEGDNTFIKALTEFDRLIKEKEYPFIKPRYEGKVDVPNDDPVEWKDALASYEEVKNRILTGLEVDTVDFEALMLVIINYADGATSIPLYHKLVSFKVGEIPNIKYPPEMTELDASDMSNLSFKVDAFFSSKYDWELRIKGDSEEQMLDLFNDFDYLLTYLMEFVLSA